MFILSNYLEEDNKTESYRGDRGVYPLIFWRIGSIIHILLSVNGAVSTKRVPSNTDGNPPVLVRSKANHLL